MKVRKACVKKRVTKKKEGEKMYIVKVASLLRDFSSLKKSFVLEKVDDLVYPKLPNFHVLNSCGCSMCTRVCVQGLRYLSKCEFLARFGIRLKTTHIFFHLRKNH